MIIVLQQDDLLICAHKFIQSNFLIGMNFSDSFSFKKFQGDPRVPNFYVIIYSPQKFNFKRFHISVWFKRV